MTLVEVKGVGHVYSESTITSFYDHWKSVIICIIGTLGYKNLWIGIP
jgi:hypothetical protein